MYHRLVGSHKSGKGSTGDEFQGKKKKGGQRQNILLIPILASRSRLRLKNQQRKMVKTRES
jgi:hypothetical protein